jgi:hypothetical protein
LNDYDPSLGLVTFGVGLGSSGARTLDWNVELRLLLAPAFTLLFALSNLFNDEGRQHWERPPFSVQISQSGKANPSKKMVSNRSAKSKIPTG